MSYNNPLHDFEARNARQWDEDTVFSEEPDHFSREETRLHVQAGGPENVGDLTGDLLSLSPPSAIKGSKPFSLPHASHHETLPLSNRHNQLSTRPTAHASTAKEPLHLPNHLNQSSSPTSNVPREPIHLPSKVNHLPPKPAQATPPGPTNPGSKYNPRRTPSSQPSRPGVGFPRERREVPTKARESWATPQGLISTRKQHFLDVSAANAAEKSMYFRKLDDDAEAPVTACFVWPDRYETPLDLIGSKLDALSNLRPDFQVYLDWDGDSRLFRIISFSHNHGERDVCAVIKTIRRIVLHAKSLAASAPPLRLVEPPSTQTMRTVIRPILRSITTSSTEIIRLLPAVIGFKLDGPRPRMEDLGRWRSKREGIQKENFEMLRSHLIKYIGQLAPVQDWMRMRLHFGTLQFRECSHDLQDSNLGFDVFRDLMKSTTSGVEFNKQIDDATIAIKTKEQLTEYTDKFCPVDPMTSQLKDIQAKHTEILFLRRNENQQEYRIEADIDIFPENKKGKYQIGTMRYYLKNQRNTHMEVTSVDVHQGLDWILEVVTDRPASDFPPDFPTYLKGTLPSFNVEGQDSYGLTYPRIAPHHSIGFIVKTVALRSTFQFLHKESNYVVEVSVYREWVGRETQKEAKMMTAVSMFHPDWESEMEAVGSTSERQWERGLKSFFPDGKETDGLKIFLEDVQWIQTLLSTNAKNLKVSDIMEPQVGISSKEA